MMMSVAWQQKLNSIYYDELYDKIRDYELDISDCIETFLQDDYTIRISKRRVERISTVQELVTEFENQMLINPEKRGVKYFCKIVQYINNTSIVINQGYVRKVETLAKKLETQD